VSQCAKNQNIKRVSVSGQALSGGMRDKIERVIGAKRKDMELLIF
jgi:hypothetical protein